jgi:membrane-bound acyltransferase YfiQ involved in biofilm formation
LTQRERQWSIESVLKFLNSYPMWAKVLALSGVVLTVATLVLAPRTVIDAIAQDKPNTAGAVLRMLGVVCFLKIQMWRCV